MQFPFLKVQKNIVALSQFSIVTFKAQSLEICSNNVDCLSHVIRVDQNNPRVLFKRTILNRS